MARLNLLVASLEKNYFILGTELCHLFVPFLLANCNVLLSSQCITRHNFCCVYHVVNKVSFLVAGGVGKPVSFLAGSSLNLSTLGVYLERVLT